MGQGRDAGRVAAIRQEVGEVADAADLRLMLVLEAMRPTREDMLYEDDLRRALEKAQFHEGPLLEFVRELLRFHAQSEADPFARLRAELNKAPAPVVNYTEVLQKKRDELHNRNQAHPPERGPRLRWPVRALLQSVGCLHGEDLALAKGGVSGRVCRVGSGCQGDVGRSANPHLEKIADRHHVRKKSRKTMDRVVKNLMDGLRDINDTMRR